MVGEMFTFYDQAKEPLLTRVCLSTQNITRNCVRHFDKPDSRHVTYIKIVAVLDFLNDQIYAMLKGRELSKIASMRRLDLIYITDVKFIILLRNKIDLITKYHTEFNPLKAATSQYRDYKQPIDANFSRL
jgi:hypothetical protein